MPKHQIRAALINLILAITAGVLLYVLLKPDATSQTKPSIHHIKRMHVSWRLTGILWDPTDPNSSAVVIQTRNGKSKLIDNHGHINAQQTISIINAKQVVVTEGKQTLRLWLKKQSATLKT